MNNFYIIKGGVACKETKNIYPQVVKPVAPKGSELYNKIINLRNKPNPDAKDLVIELELDPKTNPTDFISQSWIGSIGLLVSQMAFDFLSGFNLQPEMETYKTIIHHKGKTYDYIWLNPVYDFDIDIDFEKTLFYLFDFLEDSKNPIQISDARDLNKKSMDYNPIPIIKTDTLVLKNKDIANFDLLFMSIGSTNLRVSEKLKNEIEKSNLTAFEFNPALPFC